MKVKVYRKDEEMMVVSQGGLNPNPVFPQWNAMNIYPNQYWGTALRRKCDRTCRMLYIENEYLKVGCCHEKLGQAEKATEFWQRAVSIENPIAWEPAYWYAAWRKRYFQALANIKLGNPEQANIIFDAIESVARNSFKMPYSARRDLMDLVIQARTGGGVVSGEAVEVETLAES